MSLQSKLDKAVEKHYSEDKLNDSLPFVVATLISIAAILAAVIFHYTFGVNNPYTAITGAVAMVLIFSMVTNFAYWHYLSNPIAVAVNTIIFTAVLAYIYFIMTTYPDALGIHNPKLQKPACFLALWSFIFPVTHYFLLCGYIILTHYFDLIKSKLLSTN